MEEEENNSPLERQQGAAIELKFIDWRCMCLITISSCPERLLSSCVCGLSLLKDCDDIKDRFGCFSMLGIFLEYVLWPAVSNRMC